MASIAPLDSQALVAAVCQDPNHHITQPVDIDVEFVLSSCQNLVVIDDSEIIRFSHLSVREYLEVHHPSIAEKSDEFIANMYLSLLSIPRIRPAYPDIYRDKPKNSDIRLRGKSLIDISLVV